MNAPNFDFGSEDNSGSLPASVADDVRSLRAEPVGDPVPRHAMYAEWEEEPQTTGYRELFFKCLGLGLKYRWLILSASVVGLLIGFFVTLTTVPIYRATATIQIDLRAPKVVKLDSPDPGEVNRDSFRFYQTQFDLLKSRSLAEQVVTNLNLADAASFLQPKSTSSWTALWHDVLPARAKVQPNLVARKQRAVGMVRGGLEIDPVPSSSLVRISYNSPSPGWAQKIANGVAETFIKQNMERRYGATSYARQFLRDRLDELKLKLEKSEQALVDYAKKMNIVSAGGKSGDTGDADLTSLTTALNTAQMDVLKYEQLWRQAKATHGLSLPQFRDDPAIQALQKQRGNLLTAYQEKLQLYKPAYPDMIKLRAQINQIDRQIKATSNSAVNTLKAQYDAARERVKLLQGSVGEAKSKILQQRSKGVQYRILQRDVDTNRSLYNGLLQQYKDVGVAGAVGTNNISMVDEAQRPGGPYTPRLNRNLLIWLLISLMAAAGGIAVLEILDDTFKAPEDVEEQLGLAVLGAIPMSDSDVITKVREVPNSPLAEAFRSFRTALQFSTDSGTPKSILVTSARPSEGKSTTALGLAVNLAQLGVRVLLIDADLRNPSQHHLLARDNETGLANYLAGATVNREAFQDSGVSGLSFMASGPIPPNPAELLAGPKMLSLLSVAGEKFDTVIVDAPPVVGLADAPLLSSFTAATLLVMAAGETRRGVIKAALKRLHFARARVIGAVLNKFDFRAAAYGYGYRYGYGYGYGYGALDYYGYGAEEETQKKPAQVKDARGG